MPPQERKLVPIETFIRQPVELAPLVRYPTAPEQGTGGAILSTISPVIDILSRGQYASARFFDSLMDESKGIFDALSDSWDELVSPKKRLGFEDLIKKNAPNFAKDNPTTTNVLGFVLNIALDPTTYLGAGLAKSGIQVGRKTLTSLGREVMADTVASLAKREVPRTLVDDLMTLPKELDRIPVADVIARQLGIPSTVKNVTLKDIKNNLAPVGKVMEDQLTSLGMQFGRNNPWIQFRGKINEKILDELGVDAKGFAQGRALFRKMTGQEITETAEKRIASLIELFPQAEFKLFEKSGLRLKVGIPLLKQFDVPGTQQLFSLLGVNKLADKISALKAIEPIQRIGSSVVRRFGLDASIGAKAAQEFEKAILSIENAFDSNVDSVIRMTKRLFKDVEPARREVIGETMSKIDDETRIIEDALSKIGASLDQTDADIIAQKHISAAGFNPLEMSIVSTLQQSYKDMMLLEKNADVLKHSILNYNPRMYELLADPTEFNLLWRMRGTGLGGRFTPAMHRKFRTLEEAEAAGFVPVLDASMLYAHRMLQSRRALAVRQFNDSVGEIFNIEDFKATNPKHFGQLPATVRDDIRLLGDAVYPSGTNESAKFFLKGWDTMNRFFRRMATVASPAFSARQLIGNTVQAAFVLGAKAFKAFDPRASIDASLLLLDRGKPTKNLPQFVNDFFAKFLGAGETGSDAVFAQRIALEHITGEERLKDYAQQMSIRTTLGQEIPGTDLMREMHDHAILRGQGFLGEPFNVSLEKELAYNSNSLKAVGKQFLFPDDMRFKMFGKEFILPLPWAKLPRLIEDYSRAMAYISGRRMGYTPAESAKIVNKAFFDYGRGLTHIERNLIRRMLPFYTYKRFSIPLVLQASLTQPAIPATTDKVIRLFDKLFNSDNPEDTLSDAEREIFGKSLLIEIPRIFRGFDKDGKVKFNLLNNITPLDSLDLFVFDKRGNFDAQRTVEKTFLAALTPYAKLPVEHLIDKQFFTNRTLDQASRLGEVSESTMSAILPDFVKDAMGWEERTDKRTGKTAVFVNPWLTHYMIGVVPPLKEFIKVAQPEQTPLDVALRLVIGVTSTKLDLKEQRIWQGLAENREIRDLKGQVRGAFARGAKNDFEKKMESLRELIRGTKESRIIQTQGQIRGQGIVRETQETPEPEERPRG